MQPSNLWHGPINLSFQTFHISTSHKISNTNIQANIYSKIKLLNRVLFLQEGIAGEHGNPLNHPNIYVDFL